MAQPFFQSGDYPDLAYCHLRDTVEFQKDRDFVERLWRQYSPHADTHFLQDSKAHFVQRFWEMYLFITLRRRGFRPRRFGAIGPDFVVEQNTRRIWFEAVAPDAGTGPHRVEYAPPGIVSDIPVEKILLRFTNALAEKRHQYLRSREKGIVRDDDGYVLAINSSLVPYARAGSTTPFFLQAVLPIGHLNLTVDRESRKIINRFYQWRDSIAKSAHSAVRTDTFLDPNYQFVSGILHSGTDPINRARTFGGDFSLLQNPHARQPVDPNAFSWCHRWVCVPDDSGIQVTRHPATPYRRGVKTAS